MCDIYIAHSFNWELPRVRLEALRKHPHSTSHARRMHAAPRMSAVPPPPAAAPSPCAAGCKLPSLLACPTFHGRGIRILKPFVFSLLVNHSFTRFYTSTASQEPKGHFTDVATFSGALCPNRGDLNCFLVCISAIPNPRCLLCGWLASFSISSKRRNHSTQHAQHIIRATPLPAYPHHARSGNGT